MSPHFRDLNEKVMSFGFRRIEIEIIKFIWVPVFLFKKKKKKTTKIFVFIPKTLPVNEHGITQKITL